MPAGLRKVYQYDLEGNFVNEYENISAASFAMKEQATSLYHCITGKYNFSRGYFWSYNFYLKLPNDILVKIRKSKNYKSYILNNQLIFQYDLKGNFIRKYDNVKAISNNVIYQRNIRRVLEGRHKISYDYIWKTQFYEKLPKEILKKHIRTNAFEIYQYDENGNFIKKFDNITIASKELKLSRGSLSNLLDGVRHKKHKNKIYRKQYYKKLPKEILKQHTDSRYREILQLNLKGKLLKTWSSYKEVQKKFNNSNICSVLNGRRESASGFIWKYKDIV